MKFCSVTMNEINFFFVTCEPTGLHKYILVFYGLESNRSLYSEFSTIAIGGGVVVSIDNISVSRPVWQILWRSACSVGKLVSKLVHNLTQT